MGRAPKGTGSDYEALLKELPWLAHLEPRICLFSKPSAASSSSSRTQMDESDELIVPDESEMFQALKDLEKERASVIEEGGQVQVDFVSRVRGRVTATST